MVVFNYTGRELSGKIVYYGPALSGKTTNLEFIYGKTPSDNRGKMVSMKTKAESTLFFDLLPISRGHIGDFKVRFLLYTVPGQVYYNATRKLVLKGADAIVFVADSQRSQLAANIDSLRNLRTNLLEYGMCLDDLPWVITYNKRDMPDAMPVEELEAELNPYGVPSFGQVAVSGDGVFDSFDKVSEMLMQRLEAQLKGDTSKSVSRPAVRPATRARVAAPPAPPAGGLDAGAVREVKEAIRGASGITPGAAPPSPKDSLVIQRGAEGMTPAGPGAPAAAVPAPATSAATATVPRSDEVLVVERSLVLPVSMSDLANGSRKVRLVLDLEIRPVR